MLLTDPEVATIILMPTDDVATSGEPNESAAHDRGWLVVRPGGYAADEGILLLSEVLAPNRPPSKNEPVTWLRWLKRRVKQDGVVAGVRGTNIVYGGSSDYHDIRYSRGALELLGRGATWKQFASGNAVFEPYPSA